MVKVLRALPGEQRRIDLKPWLYRIAHNESIEVLRRRRETRELDAELPAPGPGLAEEAGTRERLRRLLVDLDELPERQRETLVMRELAGLEFAEIGAALGTSAEVARQTVYEARLSLRQMDEGREMSCATVTRALSDGDGRVTRRRDVRSHLRACADCRRFREEIEGRRRDLRGALSAAGGGRDRASARSARPRRRRRGRGSGGGDRRGRGQIGGRDGGAERSRRGRRDRRGRSHGGRPRRSDRRRPARRRRRHSAGFGAAGWRIRRRVDPDLRGRGRRSPGELGGERCRPTGAGAARVVGSPQHRDDRLRPGEPRGDGRLGRSGGRGRAGLLGGAPARQGSRKVAPERLPARTADGGGTQGRRTRLVDDQGPRWPVRGAGSPGEATPSLDPERGKWSPGLAWRDGHPRTSTGRRELRGSDDRAAAPAGGTPSRSGPGTPASMKFSV